MDILLKRKMNRRVVSLIGFIVSLIIISLILWTCALVTDYIRFKSNQIPVFTIYSAIEDKVNGYASVYNGLGYKFVQNYENSRYTNEFYILNYKVATEELIYE